MAVKRVPLIAGNWKMNLNHLEANLLIQKLAWTLSEAKHDSQAAEIAIFPPFTDLRSVQTLIAADKLDFALGAQDLSEHDQGAFTGEISGAFLAKLDVKYVLIGHSERRQIHGESDELLARKITAALKHKLVPVICVGETEEDLESEGASAVPLRQLESALAVLKPSDEFVIAYEPVWAIGTGLSASPEQAQEVAAVLRASVAEHLGEEVAARTRILYGGSVKSGNVAGYLSQKDVDGALVGGASIVAEEFAAIAQFQKHIGFSAK